eukprot:7773827-Pyramimonas_sp.AAC.1
MKQLSTAFKQQPLCIVGTVETRFPRSGVSSARPCRIIHAEAVSKHTGGCSLWLHTAFEILLGVRIAPKHCCVLAAAPRYLLVAVRVESFDMDILVARAPHSKKPEHETRAWWAQLAGVLHDHRAPGVELISLLDANARIGSTLSRFVRPIAAEAQILPGQYFHQFLEDSEQRVPSTFLESHVPSAT